VRRSTAGGLQTREDLAPWAKRVGERENADAGRVRPRVRCGQRDQAIDAMPGVELLDGPAEKQPPERVSHHGDGPVARKRANGVGHALGHGLEALERSVAHLRGGASSGGFDVLSERREHGPVRHEAVYEERVFGAGSCGTSRSERDELALSQGGPRLATELVTEGAQAAKRHSHILSDAQRHAIHRGPAHPIESGRTGA
jgi:hypothetical protein